MTDWVGNSGSIYKTIGASNHTAAERQPEDYYATEPKAAELLCDLLQFHPIIWECACGEGHLVEVFKARGYHVWATDIVDRGYGNEILDFLSIDDSPAAGSGFYGDIITNPPYKFAQQFVEQALSFVADGYYVAMFLKLTFMEGKARKKLFEEYPPKFIYVSSSRLLCAKNGDFESARKGGGSAVAYGWYIWQKGYKGDTFVKWFN